MGKGEYGALADTVQNLWYGIRHPLSTDVPAKTCSRSCTNFDTLLFLPVLFHGQIVLDLRLLYGEAFVLALPPMNSVGLFGPAIHCFRPFTVRPTLTGNYRSVYP